MLGFSWKLIMGVALGAVVVKESRKADGFYGWAREKFVAMLEKAQDVARTQDTPGEASREGVDSV